MTVLPGAVLVEGMNRLVKIYDSPWAVYLCGMMVCDLCDQAVLVAAVLLSSCLAVAAYCYARRTQKVFILDFSVFHPPEHWKFPRELIRKVANVDGRVLPEHIDFMMRLAERTGLGDETPVLPEVHQADRSLANIHTARKEFAATCITTVEALLAKAGVKALEVDFVITNSSLFNPTPSLSATIMNHFKMGHRTRGYSLGGMGCSAGVIALDLAKELLELHPNCYVLVVSHENITNSIYVGRDPSMLVCNCLFRCNGSAVLVTNKRRDASRAKYVVRNIVRTNLAADDAAFNCVQQTEDEDRIVGIRLRKELLQVAERALRDNMTALGPVVLPLSEKLRFAASTAVRFAGKRSKILAAVLPASWRDKLYIPDFKQAFDHFCIHSGGRGVIDGLEQQMQLSRRQVEPSRAVLYRFGNVSSTSVWYDLAYIEARQGITRNQRIWQLAFGSGFKFNSSVLIANRNISDADGHPAWTGFDVAAMWEALDKVAAEAAAAKAAKAACLAAEKAAATAAAATGPGAERAGSADAEVRIETAGNTTEEAAVKAEPVTVAIEERKDSGMVQVQVTLRNSIGLKEKEL